MSDGDSGRRVVDGRFALEARLGGGGMGTVWRARDLVLDRAVALKEVRPPDPALAEYDPEAARTLRERVLREARALARVDHPGVVTIHHVVDGGPGSYPWLVMELVTGGSLQDRLDRGPMPPRDAARLGRDVLAALRATHAVGIQHRDVKPANVLLRPDGRPVLTDFGIAAIREATSLTATGSVIGTPDYMAPERITGDDGGPGSDLWSLAMMLYVAVEGRHPLRRPSTLATLAAVLNEELPPPSQAGPLTGVLTALLVRDPAARPAAEAVDGMLAAVIRGAAGPDSVRAPVASADREPRSSAASLGPGTTSYRLPPPPGAPAAAPAASTAGAVTPAAATPAASAVGDHRTAGPQDAVPRDGAGAWPGVAEAGSAGAQPVTVTPGAGPGRRNAIARRIAVGSTVLAAVVTAVLVWTLVPGDDGKGSPKPPAAEGSPSAGRPTPGGAGPSASTPDTQPTPTKAPTKDLLTPDGLREAVAALKARMGTDRVGSFTAYPDFVSVQGMVEGSDKRYDSYTYRAGAGVTKGITSGTLSGGELPVRLGDFDWDVVPGLLAKAHKQLNVKNPTSRYLVVRQPNEVFDTPVELGVYLSDEYDGGYLNADLTGRVTRVMPAES